jgi:hypothetical protein
MIERVDILAGSRVSTRSFLYRKGEGMSYTARVGGYLTIDPPLRWSEFRESRFFIDNTTVGDDPDVILRLEREDVDTDEGVTTLFSCKIAVPLRVGSIYDPRNLAEDCGLLFEELKKSGHALKGELVVQPTDYGDGGIWRVVVDDEGARKEMAKLQWPDGSEVQLP